MMIPGDWGAPQQAKKSGFPKEGNPDFLQMYGRLPCLRLEYYNGPIVSDHSSKNYREHGKIQQESEKETTP